MLKTKRLSLVPTFKCTLKCKLCSNHMPDFRHPPSAETHEITEDIDELFKIFDRIEWLQFVGGEIFIHDGMAEVYRHCLRYRDQFDKLILETNATLLPREDEISILREYGDNCKIMISDYGTLSRKRDEFIEILANNKIPYVLKKYHGENQHFDGWIDNTLLHDYGESEDVVMQKASGCAQVRLENMHCFKGKLHRCSNSLFMLELGVYTPNENDYLDIHDKTKSISQKREVVLDFYKYPRTSCRYCAWKDSDTLPRYPAAEQK